MENTVLKDKSLSFKIFEFLNSQMNLKKGKNLALLGSSLCKLLCNDILDGRHSKKN